MKRILIVEDSKAQQILLMDILEEQGYKADAVSDGSEAIKFAKEKQYDLILLDINMPGITEMKVLTKIRNGGASINSNVIMITSDNDDETVKESIKRGACDYILKPFRADTLLEKVNRWI